MGVNLYLIIFAVAFVLVFSSPAKGAGAANSTEEPDPCGSSNALTSLLLAERTRQQTETDVRLAAVEAALHGIHIQTGTVVAFSARLGRDLVPLGYRQTIVFDDVITNVGAAYDRSTGIFTCPDTGLYFFDTNILSQYKQITKTELMAAGVSRTSLYSGSRDDHGSSSQSVLLHLQKGSHVFLRHVENLGNGIIKFYSTFDGYLVRKMN